MNGRRKPSMMAAALALILFLSLTESITASASEGKGGHDFLSVGVAEILTPTTESVEEEPVEEEQELGIDEKIVDDMYASFVAEHAQELSSFLQHTRKSDIEGDEEYIFEVLSMILKKTDELLGEAQVKSEKFVVSL